MTLLSIMIPTLEDRKTQYLEPLMEHLRKQQTDEVNIDIRSDRGEMDIGTKRNLMLKEARGKFVAFVDDDDWVSDTYVSDILQAIKAHDALDCVGFWGEIYFSGELGGRMIHTTMCKFWTEVPGVYYRPPNHLNPVRAEIAKRFQFQSIRTSEDHFWSMDLKESGLLNYEVFLGAKPTYIYRCKEAKRTL